MKQGIQFPTVRISQTKVSTMKQGIRFPARRSGVSIVTTSMSRQAKYLFRLSQHPQKAMSGQWSRMKPWQPRRAEQTQQRQGSPQSALKLRSKESRPPLSLLSQLLTKDHRIATWLQFLATSPHNKQVKNLCLKFASGQRVSTYATQVH